jgi:ferrous iron transport protein A
MLDEAEQGGKHVGDLAQPDSQDKPVDPAKAAGLEGCVRLGEGAPGLCGIVAAVGRDDDGTASAFDVELERRLLEIGLVEGAHVEILHQGFIGRDPIAVRVDDMRVALRRREANAVLVRLNELAAADANGTRP